MGYKSSQTLTKQGFKKSNKNSSSNAGSLGSQSIKNQKSSIYKKYKKMYNTLHSKYKSTRQSIAINSIMSRTHMGTKISSQENRQLALLDIDKLLSLSTGIMKQSDKRIHTMRMIVDIQGNRGRQRFLFPRFIVQNNNQNTTNINTNTTRLEDINQINEERVINRAFQQQNNLANPANIRINNMDQNGDQDLRTMRENQPNRNALGILRLVRAARMHYLRIGEELSNPPQIMPPAQILPMVNTESLQSLQSLPQEQPLPRMIVPQSQPLGSSLEQIPNHFPQDPQQSN